MRARSSRGSPTSSSPAPEPRFFIEDLAESLLGSDWRERIESGAFCDAEALAAARPFVAPELLTDGYAKAVAEAYGAPSPVPHVRLDDPLQAGVAARIHEGLTSATFKPHHHDAYRISVARLNEPQPASLLEFTRWLASPAAARIHLAWVGHPRWREPCEQIQVQVSRLGVGDGFERHVDTDEDAIAVVYNFTRGWSDELGGVLRYPLEEGGALSIVPRFNSVFISCPRGAPHEVTDVTKKAGRRHRYTVTTFYVLGKARQG